MYSQKKDEKCAIIKNTLSLILLTILLFIIGEVVKEYRIYGKTKTIQCINVIDDSNKISQEVSKDVYLASSRGISNTYNNSVNLNSKNSNVNIENINRNVNGFAITVDNNIFGYVLSAQEKDTIIKSICESYIRELGVNTEDISYMKINGNIKTTPTELKLCQLSESSEISKEIYEASMVNKNLLDLELSLRKFEEEVIEAPVRVEEDSSIYMGEEVVMQGEDGKKEVYKEVIYEGLTKTEETVLNENILVEPVATVVHKGSKNPYYDGVTFLSRPVEGGYISSYYGEERVNSYHKGLDIAENQGEDIIASFDGEVIFAGYNDGGYGNLVIVQHSDDMKTYYAHLSEIYVSQNQVVKKGETIGAVGSTGYSTGPHLHFELRINDTPVNPLNYIVQK
ncbi:Murein hydrolase activator NlpD precursor [uncultured Clostridium sp.]|uniref:peptidoglycan DD-metalloendopeptidase family protein n=1 Tax=uncultured Clostridium sp. TaxID=59620 RepID=UPI000821E533|nr:peptidoglycan DD-metalloendopeptidase family protein [uncultured Clostridium sp.]SCK02004.1 Murein hydrolase activator NlpD precursor [uncultured Clostridium sp.]